MLRVDEKKCRECVVVKCENIEVSQEGIAWSLLLARLLHNAHDISSTLKRNQ